METNDAALPFKHRLALALIPVAAFLLRLMGLTWRVRLVDPHGTAPQSRPKEKYIYAFWHNQQILSMVFFRNFGIRVLVSRSRDGEYIARALEHFGFKTVRSSTSSGKVNALRGLARELRAGFPAAITPDGPRGPVYVAQPGAVFLGALTQEAVVPYGCAVSRPWRLRSWDRFEIPKPFSNAVIVFGEPLRVPARMTEADVEQWNGRLQADLNRLRDEARRLLSDAGGFDPGSPQAAGPEAAKERDPRRSGMSPTERSGNSRAEGGLRA